MDKEILKFLKEDVLAKDNKLQFVYDKNKGKYIDTHLGKSNKKIKFQPRQTKLSKSGVIVYSAYKKNSSDTTIDIMKSIKRSNDSKFKVEENDYNYFINRTALFFARVLKNKSVDTFFIMESSSSLGLDLAKRVKELLPDLTLKLLTNKIIKNIDELTLQLPDNIKISDTQMNSLRKIIEKAKENGKFSIKKIQPKYRRFFVNWIKIDDSAIKYITNKNIVIFDDYITSGATLDEVCYNIKKFSPKSIIALTLMK